MAAQAFRKAKLAAEEGEGGKRGRQLRRRDTYRKFDSTHEENEDQIVSSLTSTFTKPKITKVQISHEKGLPGMCHHNHSRCVFFCVGLRDNQCFQLSVILVIFLAGILVGIQTYPIERGSQLAITLGVMDIAVLWIFVLEIVVKFAAEGKTPWLFFKDSWNVFDFFIVAVGFMPIGGGGSVTALRLLRLLRVLKLVKALPQLRILVIGLIKSFSSIAYIGALLILQFFLFAVFAVSVFGHNDPIHLGTLHIAFLTLFRSSTFEDWTDVMYIGMYGCKHYGYDGMEDQCPDDGIGGTTDVGYGWIAALYWVTFITLASFMVLNLFIGVITSSMQDAKDELVKEAEAEAEAAREKNLDDVLSARIDMLEGVLETMHSEVKELAIKERIRGATNVIKLSKR